MRLISSLGVREGGLARIQNCSAGVGGVRPGLYETLLYEALLRNHIVGAPVGRQTTNS